MKYPSERSGFVKMQKSVLYSKGLTPLDKIIYISLLDKQEYAERFDRIADGWIEVSISQLAKDFDISRNTAKKSISKLCKAGLIERQKAMVPGEPDGYHVITGTTAAIILDCLEQQKKTGS